MRRWKTILLRHTLVLPCIMTAGLLLEALAQETPCLRRTVMASVTLAGQPVASVPTSSFKGEFRGKPVRILSATRDLGPRRIVVLLDASGSMLESSNGKWLLARRAASDLVMTASPEFQMALLVFAKKVDAVVGFAEGRKATAEKLTALGAGTKTFPKGPRLTALYDAILVALGMLEPAHPGDIIYAITDGGDNASRARPDEVERALFAAGVRFFTFFLLPYRTRPPEEMAGLSDLPRLAETTGGNALFTPGSQGYGRGYKLDEKEQAALGFSLKMLYSQVIQFYRLEVELPEPVNKRRGWKLEMVNERGAKMKEWQVAYQATLLPCKSTTERSKENK